MLDIQKMGPVLDADLKAFSILIVGIIAHQLVPAFVSVLFIMVGVQWIILSSPSYTSTVNNLAYEAEEYTRPVTGSENWDWMRPIFYIASVLALSALILI